MHSVDIQDILFLVGNKKKLGQQKTTPTENVLGQPSQSDLRQTEAILGTSTNVTVLTSYKEEVNCKVWPPTLGRIWKETWTTTKVAP
jgi:hypothetical protein